MKRKAGKTRSVIVMPSAVGPLWRRNAGAPGDPGHLVDEQHQQHVGAAQQVDRPDARADVVEPRQVAAKGNTIAGAPQLGRT